MGIAQVSLKESLEVAIRIDTALDMTNEEYDEYLKTCDKSLLKCHEGQTPIFFKMRKVIPYHLSLKIENMKMDMVKKREGDKTTNEIVPKISWMAEEVRFAIVDIINPDSCEPSERLEFKRESDGHCSEEIMGFLVSTNSHMDLWTARQSVKNNPINKKK